jgi:hypothetical protein
MSLWLRRSLQTTALTAAMVVVQAWPMSGPASAPKYDVATESKMKVIVEELKLPAKGNEKEVAHLMVKSGSETLDIYLCPKSFLDDMGATYAKGDEVTVTGSKIKQEGGDLILAREVVKGPDTLLLRDDKGKPVWDWHH